LTSSTTYWCTEQTSKYYWGSRLREYTTHIA